MQLALALGAPLPCRRCATTGEVYYLPQRTAIGGKRIACPDCQGSGIIGSAAAGCDDRHHYPQTCPPNCG